MADYYVKLPPITGGGSAGVSSLNTLTGDVLIVGSGGISVGTAGDTITISEAHSLTIGNLDSGTLNSKGLFLSATNVLSAQSADITHPGLVNNVTQQFNGFKQFNGGGIGTDIVNDLNNVMAWDVSARIFKGTAGQSVINLPSFLLLDNNGNHSVDWNLDKLVDSNNKLSYNWLSREFSSPNGQVKLTYSDTTTLISAGAASNTALTISGATSQSGNYIQWQDSGFIFLGGINADGSILISAPFSAASSTFKPYNYNSTVTSANGSNIVSFNDESDIESSTLSFLTSFTSQPFINSSTLTGLVGVNISPSVGGSTISQYIGYKDSSFFDGGLNSYTGILLQPEVDDGNTATGLKINLSQVNVGADVYGVLVTGGGLNGFGTSSPTAQVQINSETAGQTSLIVQGFSGQVANLTEWKNSIGTTLAYVANNGSMGASGISAFGDMGVKHLIGNTSAPTIAAGAGAGTSPTISITGSDLAGKITLTSGTLPSISAVIATITFNTAFAAAPFISLTAGSGAAALSISAVYVTSTTTTFVLNSDTTGLTAASSYVWHYHCIQ